MTHTTSITSSSYFVPVGKTLTQSTVGTVGSIRWAPQALIHSWHGRLCDTFNVVGIVGEGRYGAVFIGEHKTTQKRYACKYLKKEDQDSQALRNEVQMLRQLDHPHIVRLYETHEEADGVFLQMELCHGGDLLNRIRDDQGLSEHNARIFSRQMLSALQYCHARGIVHRDVKPDNFLLETEHPDCLVLKLADFGIATSLRATGANDSWDEPRGTLPYMAPELLRHTAGSSANSAAADLWGCGVTIYVMLCGYLPFDTDRARICSGQPPNFSGKDWRGISNEAVDLIQKLLSPLPEERPSAQQALAHEWFEGVSPVGDHELESSVEFSPDEGSGPSSVLLQDFARLLLRSLRRWRRMPKLRRIALAAVGKRLEGQHDAKRVAEAVYALFGGDSSDALTSLRLVEVVNSALSGSLVVDPAQAPSVNLGSLPGMTLSLGSPRDEQPSVTRTPSGTITGLHVRSRVRAAMKRLAGSPTLEDSDDSVAYSAEGHTSLAELRYIFSALDGMKTGTVDYTLLVAALLPLSGDIDEEQVQEAFCMFDVRRRGCISARDIRDAVGGKAAGLRPFVNMVAEFDTNGDGALDMAEFCSMIHGRHGP